MSWLEIPDAFIRTDGDADASGNGGNRGSGGGGGGGGGGVSTGVPMARAGSLKAAMKEAGRDRMAEASSAGGASGRALGSFGDAPMGLYMCMYSPQRGLVEVRCCTSPCP